MRHSRLQLPVTTLLLLLANSMSGPALALDSDLKPGFPVQMWRTGGTYKSGPGLHVLVANIDDEPDLEIVVPSLGSGPLYAFKFDGSAVPGWPLFNLPYGVPYAALGNLAGDGGKLEAAIGLKEGVLAAVAGDGTVLPGWPRPADNYISSPPTPADIDGDGVDEIFIGEEDRRLHAYRADGTPLPGWPSAYGNGAGGQSLFTPAAADLDGDSTLEFVSASSGSSSGVGVYAFHSNGTPVAGFPITLPGSTVTTYVAIGDVDGDGALEIVAVGKQAVQPYAPRVYVIGSTGAIERTIDSAGTLDYGTAPALADLDGDTVPEIIVQTKNLIEVWKGDGTKMPGWPVAVGNTQTNAAPVVGDVDGDQQPDVVTATYIQIGERSMLHVFDRAGNPHPRAPKEYPFGQGTTPAIADIDRDGRNEVIVAGAPVTGFSEVVDSVWAFDFGGAAHGPIHWGQFGGGPKHQARYVAPTNVRAAVSDLALAVTTTAPAIYGAPLTYALTVTNKGPVDVTGVMVSHRLSGNLPASAMSPDCQPAGANTVICRAAALAASASTAFDITVTPEGDGRQSARSVVVSDATDSNLGDNEVGTTVAVGRSADLRIGLTDSADPARVGRNFSYRVSVANAGPQEATGVTSTQDLPPQVTVMSVPAACTAYGSRVACNFGTMAAGASTYADVVVRPNVGKVTMTTKATVTAGNSVMDPDTSNNTATQTTQVR